MLLVMSAEEPNTTPNNNDENLCPVPYIKALNAYDNDSPTWYARDHYTATTSQKYITICQHSHQ